MEQNELGTKHALVAVAAVVPVHLLLMAATSDVHVLGVMTAMVVIVAMAVVDVEVLEDATSVNG